MGADRGKDLRAWAISSTLDRAASPVTCASSYPMVGPTHPAQSGGDLAYPYSAFESVSDVR